MLVMLLSLRAFIHVQRYKCIKLHVESFCYYSCCHPLVVLANGAHLPQANTMIVLLCSGFAVYLSTMLLMLLVELQVPYTYVYS